jgi:hypothetical protein
MRGFILAVSIRLEQRRGIETPMRRKSKQPFLVPLLVTVVGGVVVLLVEVFILSPNRVPDVKTPADQYVPHVPINNMPGAGDVATKPTLRALTHFSYALDLSWGPIYIGISRHQIERRIGSLQCRYGDYQGYYCSCHGMYDDVELLLELRNLHKSDDPEVCRKPDTELTSFTVLLTPAERSASHETIVNVLRDRLPRFRHLHGAEPGAGEERSRYKPVYTFADGKHEVVLNYEGDALHIR